LISFDTPQEIRQKADYIKAKDLGGAMYWEMSQDKTGKESLVGTMVETLGRGNLQQRENLLSYPKSQYDNIKAGMPE
jgi:chitinase